MLEYIGGITLSMSGSVKHWCSHGAINPPNPFPRNIIVFLLTAELAKGFFILALLNSTGAGLSISK